MKPSQGMLNKLLSGITEVSKPSEVLTSFRGPLIQFKVVKSINREKGTIRFWIVFSQGKRSTLLRYLWGKLLWDELNSIERNIFWSLEEITKDKSIFLGLKALGLGISKKLLRERLKNGSIFGLNYISRQQYLSIKGMVNFFLLEKEIQLRSVPKYSGYTKHYKDKGSLRPERVDNYSEILDPISDITEEVIMTYLTVGDISLFGGRVLHLDKSQKRRNGPQ
jgi:hypothetical protein